MGGAEGTKLDLDFVEMERVSLLKFSNFFLANYLIIENGCDGGIS